MLASEPITENRIPFTAEDERKIASAGMWGMIVAGTSIATGLLSLGVQGSAMSKPYVDTDTLAVSMVQAAIAVLINVWLLQAGVAMRKVALTDEADQAHLLAAFRKLRGYFMVQVVLVLLAILVGVFFGAMDNM